MGYYDFQCYYILEDDMSYVVEYEDRRNLQKVGDVINQTFYDIEKGMDKFYVKYALFNGDIFYRNFENKIECNSMVASLVPNQLTFYIICTKDIESVSGKKNIEVNDFLSEIYLTANNDSETTQGSDDVVRIDIRTGATSDSFASYGATYSPSISCEMFENDFTDKVVFEGNKLFAWGTLSGSDFSIPLGIFQINEEPIYTESTVVFNAVGKMEYYMARNQVDIKAMNKFHENQLKEKYIDSGKRKFLNLSNYCYYWEHLPEDFLRVTGSPLYIENWQIIKNMMLTYNTEALMIPFISSVSENSDDTFDVEHETRITWREFLSGIAILLRGNVIERNNAFFIKTMPLIKEDGYIPVFDKDWYDDSSNFGRKLMCPSEISVNGTNWYFYGTRETATIPSSGIGFGYYDGESNVVINDKKSEYSNTNYYSVSIDCPWILFETADRKQSDYISKFDISQYLGHSGALKWNTHLSTRNQAFLYHKASIVTSAWNPSLYAGNIVEFEDHNGDSRFVYIGEITLHYDGSVYADITSPADVQSQNQSTASGGSDGYSSNAVASANGANLGVMFGVSLKNSSITGSKIADSTIENSHIVNGTLDGKTKIKDASIDFAKIDDAFISDLTTDSLFAENLTAAVANIGSLTADDAIIKNIFSENIITDKAIIDVLQSNIIDADVIRSATAEFGYITSDEADLKYATIELLQATDGKIDTLSSKAITTENLSAEVADLGYLSAESAEIGYAKIDLSNVGTQVVDTSMIKDGAVTNEKVGNLSANKITSGTIDASKITVTNLNADNLTVGTINGKLIGTGSVDLDKLSQEVPTKEYLDNVQKELQGQIDGAIETFTKSEIPTLNNEPANAWTNSETRKKHIGDVCYVLNPTSSANGYCYRFANTGTEASPSYEWVLIKDSDVTKALQDIIDINGEITGIKQFDTDISSWKTDTDEELSSLKLRTTTLETDIGSKVESSVFNEVKQTIDENSASIMSLSDTVSKKADGSTVETLKNTVNEAKQTADSNSLSISSMQTEMGKKADGSTVTELSQRTSNLEQNLDGFKTEVSKTYTSKTEFDNLEIGGRNLYLGTKDFSGYWANKAYWSVSSETYKGFTVMSRTGAWSGLYQNFYGVVGETYTFSGYVKKTGGATTVYTNKVGTTTNDGTRVGTKLNEWEHFSVTATVSTSGSLGFRVENFSSTETTYVCGLKLENGNKDTPWTPAIEDTEESITEVKTIAEQTADKFSWLVKSGTSSSNFTLTDRMAELTAEIISLNGDVKVDGNMLVDGSITADKIDVDDLFAEDIYVTGSFNAEKTAQTNSEKITTGYNISGDTITFVEDYWLSPNNNGNHTLHYRTSNNELDYKGLALKRMTYDSSGDREYTTTYSLSGISSYIKKADGSYDNNHTFDIAAYNITIGSSLTGSTRIESPLVDVRGQLEVTGTIKEGGKSLYQKYASVNAEETYGYVTPWLIAGVTFAENELLYGYSKLKGSSAKIKHFGGALQINTTSALSDEWRAICELPQEARPSKTVRTFASLYSTNTSRLVTQYAINILTNGQVMMLGSIPSSSSYRILIPTVYYI